MSLDKESGGSPSASSSKTGGLFQSTKGLPYDSAEKSSSSSQEDAKNGSQPATSGETPPAREVERSVFEFNIRYFLGVRGIMNLFHLLSSLIALSLLSVSCQYRPNPSAPIEGFFCPPPETFLFVVSCGAFFTSFLYLGSCLCSKRTSHFLHRTVFEACYFTFYFILLLTSSFALMISIIYWNDERISSGKNYDTTKSAIIFGLIGAFCYGISALWFFIVRCYYNQRFL